MEHEKNLAKIEVENSLRSLAAKNEGCTFGISELAVSGVGMGKFT